MQDAVEQKCVQILIDLFADGAYKSSSHVCRKTTPYSKKVLGTGVLSAIPDNPAVITLRAAAARPATQQDLLEHTATAKLLATLSAVAVLKLIVPAQFTAILEELVMESAATNQAE